MKQMSKEREAVHMDIMIFFVVVCVIAIIFILLLPIILPALIVIFIVAAIFIWYMKRKIVKRMNSFQEDMADFQGNQLHSDANHASSDDVIDVEFTETEEK